MTLPYSDIIDNPGLNLIVADSRETARTVQESLGRLGYSGTTDQFVSIDQVLHKGVHVGEIHRVVIVLGSTPKRGIEAARLIRELIHAPLYVIGPRDADLILAAVNAGAENFIEESDLIDTPLAQALARSRNSRRTESDYGRIICVTSARGGSGGSLTAVNLAAAFAQRLKRAALCDFDLKSGVCDALLNLRPKHTIADLGRCYERMDAAAVELALTRHSTGVHLLPSSGPIQEQLPFSEFFERVLQTLRQMFPFVVVDLPRLTSDFDSRAILSACHRFVMIVQMDFNSIRSAHRELDFMSRNGLPLERLLLVGNRVGQPAGLSPADAELALQRKFALMLPDDPATINLSVNSGAPYVTNSPSSRVGKALDSLVTMLLTEQTILSREKANDTNPETRSSKLANLVQQCRGWLMGQSAVSHA